MPPRAVKAALKAAAAAAAAVSASSAEPGVLAQTLAFVSTHQGLLLGIGIFTVLVYIAYKFEWVVSATKELVDTVAAAGPSAVSMIKIVGGIPYRLFSAWGPLLMAGHSNPSACGLRINGLPVPPNRSFTAAEIIKVGASNFSIDTWTNLVTSPSCWGYGNLCDTIFTVLTETELSPFAQVCSFITMVWIIMVIGVALYERGDNEHVPGRGAAHRAFTIWRMPHRVTIGALGVVCALVGYIASCVRGVDTTAAQAAERIQSLKERIGGQLGGYVGRSFGMHAGGELAISSFDFKACSTQLNRALTDRLRGMQKQETRTQRSQFVQALLEHAVGNENNYVVDTSAWYSVFGSSEQYIVCDFSAAGVSGLLPHLEILIRVDNVREHTKELQYRLRECDEDNLPSEIFRIDVLKLASLDFDFWTGLPWDGFAHLLAPLCGKGDAAGAEAPAAAGPARPAGPPTQPLQAAEDDAADDEALPAAAAAATATPAAAAPAAAVARKPAGKAANKGGAPAAPAAPAAQARAAAAPEPAAQHAGGGATSAGGDTATVSTTLLGSSDVQLVVHQQDECWLRAAVNGVAHALRRAVGNKELHEPVAVLLDPRRRSTGARAPRSSSSPA